METISADQMIASNKKETKNGGRGRPFGIKNLKQQDAMAEDLKKSTKTIAVLVKEVAQST